MGFVTPKDLYDQYRNLDVSTIDGESVTGLDVHEYRWNKSDETDSTQNCVAGIAHWTGKLKPAIVKHKGSERNGDTVNVKFDVPVYTNWVQSYSRFRTVCLRNETESFQATRTLTVPVDLSDLNECFYGKGSPNAIRETLRMAAALGLIGKPYGSGMTDYLDDYIGLDCSGFACNFLRANGKTMDLMNTGTGTLRTTAKANNRQSWSQIAAYDVMVWKVAHVSVVNQVVQRFSAPSRQMDDNCVGGRGGAPRFSSGTGKLAGVDLEVVESSKGQLVAGDTHTDGLNCTWYTVVEQNSDGSYLVKRQGLGGGEYSVWIAPWTAF